MIRLFTTFYDEQDVVRLEEYGKCISANIACTSIDKIHVLCEGGESLLPEVSKIFVHAIRGRPTYEDYFDLIAMLAKDDDISIVSNTDIFFDDQLKLFTYWLMPDDTVFALSRWDYKHGMKARLYDHSDSQDAWIIRGVPKHVYGDFPVGIPRCDNRIAAEFEKAGYRVLNPSYSLRCCHIHESPPRPYLDSMHSEQIPPPYKYVCPHNLFGMWRTFLYNLMHVDSRLYWRFDRRKFNQWLPVRIVSKFTRLLKRQ